MTDACDRLDEIVEEAESTGTATVITVHGRPVAVIMALEEHDSLIGTLNIFSDSDTMAAVEEADAGLAAGDLVPVDWLVCAGRPPKLQRTVPGCSSTLSRLHKARECGIVVAVLAFAAGMGVCR